MLFEKKASDKLILSKNNEEVHVYIINENEINNEYTNKNKTNNDDCEINNDLISMKHSNTKEGERENEITYETENNHCINEFMYDIENDKQNVYEMENFDKSLNDLEEKNNNLSESFQTIACKLKALNDAQREVVVRLLEKFKILFSSKPGCAKGYEHKIILKIANPNIRRTYPVPFALREAVGQSIREMLETGIIEKSISPYCNPLRIVRKSDGRVRVCLDARQLNSAVEDDLESPPLIADLLQCFHQCNFFSKIDLTHGYWQVPLHPDSRPLTAFTFGTTMYQFTRVPFGLKNAGSAFIRALKSAFEYDVPCQTNIWNELECKNENLNINKLNTIAQYDIRNEVSTYIDDSVIATKTFERHVEVLYITFSKLLAHNFTIKFEKCDFFQSTIPFLEFHLSRRGVIPDPERINIIINFEQPKNKK